MNSFRLPRALGPRAVSSGIWRADSVSVGCLGRILADPGFSRCPRPMRTGSASCGFSDGRCVQPASADPPRRSRFPSHRRRGNRPGRIRTGGAGRSSVVRKAPGSGPAQLCQGGQAGATNPSRRSRLMRRRAVRSLIAASTTGWRRRPAARRWSRRAGSGPNGRH